MPMTTREFTDLQGPGILVLEELVTLAKPGARAEFKAQVIARDEAGGFVEARYHVLFVRASDEIRCRHLHEPLIEVVKIPAIAATDDTPAVPGSILDGAFFVYDHGDDIVRLVVSPGLWELGDHRVHVEYEVTQL